MGRPQQWRQKVEEATGSWTLIMTALTSGLGGGFVAVVLYVSVPTWIQGPPNNTELSQTVEKLSAALQQCKTRQENQTRELKVIEDRFIRLEAEVYQNQTMIKDNITLKDFMIKEHLSLFTSQFLSKDWLFVVLLMGALEVAMAAVLWNAWRQVPAVFNKHVLPKFEHEPSTKLNVPNGRKSDVILGDERILRKVTQGALESKICVVAFHSGTVDKHCGEIKEILRSDQKTRDISVSQVLVSRHEQILTLPPCQLFCVFVDFNERNIILEDPNKGLGDLRLTLVQAATKMGGQVVLTYCGDSGSRSLHDGDMYNKELTSVQQHPELRRLDNMQHVFSEYDHFNSQQRAHFLNIVKSFIQ